MLEDPSLEVRVIAARTLGKLGKAAQPALSGLAALVRDQPAEVRAEATLAIGSLELDAETIRPHLATALRADEPEVRRAAMRSIQRLGPQAAIFVPDIILLAGRPDEQRSVERSLRRFERAGTDPRSVPELIEQLSHEQEAVRLLAIKFLALAGPSAKDAIPALERLREDPSAKVREQAEAACQRIKSGPDPA
jgi:HEAT repeat protein